MGSDAYLETVRRRWADAGFKPEPPAPGAAIQARKRRIKLTRFGLVETVVAVSTPHATATPEDVRTFAAAVLQTALERKSKIPRGFGSSLVVYPGFVVQDASPELRELISGHAPKHWSVIELPVVVETGSQALICYEKTPLWGAAYYRKTRREARSLLDPAPR